MPVRSTWTIAAKIRRAGMGFLPPPGLRWYRRLGSRPGGGGISGSTFRQSSSETVQDLIGALPEAWQLASASEPLNNYLRTNSKNARRKETARPRG
jgi:hypothetical protein